MTKKFSHDLLDSFNQLIMLHEPDTPSIIASLCALLSLSQASAYVESGLDDIEIKASIEGLNSEMSARTLARIAGLRLEQNND